MDDYTPLNLPTVNMFNVQDDSEGLQKIPSNMCCGVKLGRKFCILLGLIVGVFAVIIVTSFALVLELKYRNNRSAPTTEYDEANEVLLKRLEKVEETINTIQLQGFQLNNSTRNCKKISCTDVTQADAKVWNGTGGLFDIYPLGIKMEAYCDLTTDGGGWMIFQRRMDGSENFQRLWVDYVDGFGDPDGEFWLGLEKLHRITSSGNFELRIDLGDWEGVTAYAQYSNFAVGDSASKYRLNLGKYSGTAGDSLSHHGGVKFSTTDQDNDQASRNCAQSHAGGWWFRYCVIVNLNGVYYKQKTIGKLDGVEWRPWKGITRYAMKFTEMKFRPQA